MAKLAIGRGSADEGARFALHALPGLFQQGDEGLTARTGGGKIHRRQHLGQHGAGGEFAVLNMCLGLLGRQAAEPLLVGLAEADGHLLHGGEDDEQVGVQLAG
ncbi:hypothetical protein SDC9_150970 [bioreactor metagenome]|uniref:Uncharacterized protein n=1 Tax=bioreactor metagenome TaxID=1076179 RepID=A0A645ENZ3_9ZZZZ